MDNKYIFSKNLKKYMELNNKSRRDVCEAIGVSYYTFTDWVNGKKFPRMDKVEILANYFGILKSDLIEDNELGEANKKEQLTLTKKDEKDIAKRLDELLAEMNSSNALMFDGEPLDEESKELLRTSLEQTLRTAKILAKNKYTPNKYK